jgi:hypothetical protein
MPRNPDPICPVPFLKGNYSGKNHKIDKGVGTDNCEEVEAGAGVS